MSRRITTTEAAGAIGRSPATVLAMLRDGRLRGHRGDQPQRARWYVEADEAGRPLAANGLPHPLTVETTVASEVGALEARIAALEAGRAKANEALETHSIEKLRDIGLALKGALDRQDRAAELQAEAFAELRAALREQSEVLTSLLLPDDLPGTGLSQ